MRDVKGRVLADLAHAFIDVLGEHLLSNERPFQCLSAHDRRTTRDINFSEWRFEDWIDGHTAFRDPSLL